MTDVRAPGNLDIEQALIGAMVTHPAYVAAAVEFLTAGDFASTANGELFETIAGLWRDGGATDPVSVSALAGQRDHLMQLHRSCSVTGVVSVEHYCRRIVDAAVARRLAGIGQELVNDACTALDPYAVAERTVDLLRGIDTPTAKVPADCFDADALMARAEERPAEWALPGLLRYGWRALIVAFEGRGKSVLLSQLATGLAHGVQTLTGQGCPAAPALLVDLENPTDEVARRVRTVTEACGKPRAATLHVWARPAGLDLRARRDRSEFEAILRATRPALVCLGPLYKAYRVGNRERDEEAAVSTQAVLDDLRSRFGFALLMEHHAPHAEGGSRRQARPIGSSAWLRWPELGYGFMDSTQVKFSLERVNFRGDRVQAAWPDRLDRGQRFPWCGWWQEQGAF